VKGTKKPTAIEINAIIMNLTYSLKKQLEDFFDLIESLLFYSLFK